MSLRDQLEALRIERGFLTPEVVVEAATPEDHPLHDRFEWDDSVAGPKYRRIQAHELIRSMEITYRKPDADRDTTVRYYQAVQSPTGYIYVPSPEIAQDPIVRELVLREMEREWRQMRARYSEFSEFVKMIQDDLGEQLGESA